MTPLDVPRDTLNTQLSQRRPGPSVNGHSLYGSRRSSLGKSLKARVAAAQMKLKKIEEEQRLKGMELDLKKQRLQVEMERQLLNARVWRSNKPRSSCPMEVLIVAISVIDLQASLCSPSRRYTRLFTDFLPRVTTISQDRIRPRLSSRGRIFRVTFLIDPWG